MRILLRIGIGLLLLVVVGVGALLVLMPRIVRSEAVRSRIESAARDALGRDLHYGELDFGLFPPSLLVQEARVAGAAPSDPPFAEAGSIALRVALWPLLSRAVVVDSLRVEGAVVRLRRTREGIELPGPERPAPREPGTPAPAPPAPEAPPPAPAGEARVDLAVRGFALRGARILFEDRAVSPAAELELRDLDVTARVDSLEEPIGFDASARLGSRGELSARGSAGLDGTLDVELVLDAVDLAAARPYLGEDLAVAGAASGKLIARGPAASPRELRAELSLAEARIALQEVAVSGPLALVADLAGELRTPSGRFELNATDAALRYGDAFSKPPGKPATVSGRLVTRPDGKTGVDDLEVRIGNATARGRVNLGPRTRVVARVEPFDLRGWDEMVPALSAYRLQGPVRLDELTVLTAPLDVRGAVHLDSVRGQLPNRGPVQVSGSILAEGDRIRSQELELVSADQVVSLDVRLDGLGGDLAYRVEAETNDSDTNRLVSAFTSRQDTFFGLLDFDGRVSGSLADGPPLRFARGQTRLDIRDGKVVGLSLLQSLFTRFGQAGQTAAGLAGIALDVAKVFTQRDLARFYGEEFESLSGSFRLGGGVASTDDLRLVYRNYAADLKGRFDLVETKFEFQAVLTLGEAIDQALGGARSAAAAKQGPLKIPVPVRGRLDEPFRIGRNPTLDVTPELVALVARRYLAGELEQVGELQQRGKREIDEALGEGSGDLAEDLIRQVPGLGGLLGGGKPRAPAPAPAPAPEGGESPDPPPGS